MGGRSPRRFPPAEKKTSGVIRPDEMYRLDEITARMGWTESSYTEARKAGLKTHRFGKRTYVLGRDVIAVVTEDAAR